MSDNDDWDDIICEEDNPYDNPDMTFYSVSSAFEAGVKLGLENTDGEIDFNTEIDYPPMTERKIKKAFEVGYSKGATIRINQQFGNEDEEPVNPSTLIYYGNDDDEDNIEEDEEEMDDED